MENKRKIDKWKDKLTKEQYYIMREKGTEKPFGGKYWNNKEEGSYMCAACGSKLFSSDSKFNSESGWPSFADSANKKNVILKDDQSLGLHRIEVICAKCGGHLGHLFNDGPIEMGGKRYCINSGSLKFQKN